MIEQIECEECVYKQELEKCLQAIKTATKEMHLINEQNELLQKKLLLSNYRALCQKRAFERHIRDFKGTPTDLAIKTTSESFSMQLYKKAQQSRNSMEQEREQLIQQVKQKYQGIHVLFVIPLGGVSGGGNIIVSEAAAMRKFGVDARIINQSINEQEYNLAYGEFHVPTIFVNDLAEVAKIKDKYDIICATAWETVAGANFIELAKDVKTAYYVQDYEPLFFENDSLQYQMAKESYTLVKNMKCVTKTTWNQCKVKEETGVDCSLLSPSINIDLFYPEKKRQTDAVAITAMVRCWTPRRAPGETMEILQKIFWKYGNKVEIHIFGTNEIVDSEFFIKNATDFEYQNHGVTRSEETARILRNTDIFVDFSLFQAMGATALEAMASGCAVIVPQNGGATAYAVHEKNALIVDTSDLIQCEKALSRLIEDCALREKLALQAVVDVCQYYPEQSAAKFLDAILDNQIPRCKQRVFVPTRHLPSRE